MKGEEKMAGGRMKSGGEEEGKERGERESEEGASQVI